MQTTIERAGAVTFKGNPMTLLGNALQAGAQAPDFSLRGSDLSPVTLDTVTDGGKRAALLIAVPSLDTSVCALESRTFNERVAELPESVQAYVVSVDLPFAQSRWRGDEGDITLTMLSDYRDHSFGLAYGVLVKELALLARSIFIIGKDKTIRFVDIVPEITNEPNYDKVIEAALAAAK